VHPGAAHFTVVTRCGLRSLVTSEPPDNAEIERTHSPVRGLPTMRDIGELRGIREQIQKRGNVEQRPARIERMADCGLLLRSH
jgi:hypothetical protein